MGRHDGPVGVFSAARTWRVALSAAVVAGLVGTSGVKGDDISHKVGQGPPRC